MFVDYWCPECGDCVGSHYFDDKGRLKWKKFLEEWKVNHICETREAKCQSLEQES